MREVQRRCLKTGWVVVVSICLLGHVSDALASESSAESLSKLLPEPAATDGWVLEEATPEFYSRDNLFEYIDGAAEEFIDYQFDRLLVSRWQKDDATSTLTLEIYDMKAPENAFGIYSTVRSPDAEYVITGAQGVIGEYSLNFWADKYYVKIQAIQPGLRSSLNSLGNAVAKCIGPPPGRKPGILDFMVAKTEEFSFQPRTLRLVAKNMFGLDFLNWGYSLGYDVGDEETTFFILDKDSSETAKSVFDKFREYLQKEGASIEELALGNESLLADRAQQEDPVWLVRKENFLIGLLGVPDKDRCKSLLVKTLSKMEHAETLRK